MHKHIQCFNAIHRENESGPAPVCLCVYFSIPLTTANCMESKREWNELLAVLCWAKSATTTTTPKHTTLWHNPKYMLNCRQSVVVVSNTHELNECVWVSPLSLFRSTQSLYLFLSPSTLYSECVCIQSVRGSPFWSFGRVTCVSCSVVQFYSHSFVFDSKLKLFLCVQLFFKSISFRFDSKKDSQQNFQFPINKTPICW